MAFGVHIAATHRKKMAESGKSKQADFQTLFIILLTFTVTGIIFYVFMGGRFPIAIPHEYQVY